MKTRIFAIAMMVLMTLSLFIPISVSAADYTKTLLAGTYTFKDKITAAAYYIVTQEQFDEFNSYEESDFVINIGNSEIISLYIDGIFIDTDGTMLEYSHVYYTIYSCPELSQVWSYKSGYTNVPKLANTPSGWKSLFPGNNADIPQIVIPETQADTEAYNWFVANTNYNEVNGGSIPDVPNVPDMDTPEIEYTLSKGSYTLNNTLTIPDYEIIEDFASPFLVSTLDEQFNVVDVFNGHRIKIAAPSVSYNLDGTMTTVYNAPPMANAGWQNVGYKQIILPEDETVSEQFYLWFIANTTEPPLTNPPYVFSDDGITYDGNTFATYETADTKRIEIDGHYCVMTKNDTSSTIYVWTATEPLRLGTSTIKTKSGERLEYWSIKNGVITYSGDKLDFAIPHNWIAGNHSILYWDNDLPYQEFTTGMTVFQATPQDSPTLVEIVKQIPMTGVMKEMIAILPCLIALLTAFLGLRKALAILQMILQKG